MIVTKKTVFFNLILALIFTFTSANDLIEYSVERTTTSRPSPRPTRTKRMYKMCPPKFQRIGNECYYISTYKANWLDAHFECKDRNSKLAEPLRLEDRRIRKHLLQYDRGHTDKWIGANYNWEQMKWQWGYSGRDLTYQAFSRLSPVAKAQLKYHCAVLSSELRYRWSPRSCTQLNYFVCQHRMPFVSEKNRAKIYEKWNETYPNEIANEIEVIVSNPARNRYRTDNQDSRDSNRIHFVPTTVRPRSRTRTRTDLNPVNYGDNRPADRRNRGYHAAANIDRIPKVPKVNVRPPSRPTDNRMSNTAPASSFRVDLTHPNQAGQRVNGIQQRISYDEQGKPVLSQNVGQVRFGYDITTTTEVPRRRSRTRPTTTTEVPTTTERRTPPPTERRPPPTERRPPPTERRPPPPTEASRPFEASIKIEDSDRQSSSRSELDKKKQYRDQLRERLAKLSPEEQRVFFEMRKKNKKQKIDNNV